MTSKIHDSPAFNTNIGIGTVVAAGKPVEAFNSEDYAREMWLRADLATIKSWRADPAGNLMLRRTACNFNPVMAAARTTGFEVEEIVDDDAFDLDCIDTPGIDVGRIVTCTIDEKRLERLTTRPRTPR